jgi:hypothetical protein
MLGRFFLLFVEALSFVQPVGGVLRRDARGRGRASHLSGDRGVEFAGWGVQVGQWQLGADEGVAECGDGGLGEAVLDRGLRYRGLDSTPEMAAAARKRLDSYARHAPYRDPTLASPRPPSN